MTRRIALSGRSVYGRLPASASTRSLDNVVTGIDASDGITVATAGVAAGREVGAAVSGGVSWRPFRIADSISDLTIRPCGPEPVKVARSRPACWAMRRASGLAKIRWS